MSNPIRSFLIWLNEPVHVVRFQRYFGILPLTNNDPDVRSKTDKNNSNQTVKGISQVVNGLYHRNHERKITYDTNVLDECIEEMKHSTDPPETKTPTGSSDIDYKVTAWFWYYFFQIGSALGNEIFYILFFPIWIWNIDGCIARKIALCWAFFMYIGQATKDILGIPRPPPPVLQIEKRYAEEYGFPSTHAMFAAGIPFSLVFLSHQRYDFNIWAGIICATIVCLWVCLSRIYLGMHSFLDIIGGSIYALLLTYIMFRYVDTIDNFLINFALSPMLSFSLGVFLIKCYPCVKQWSTARSDTTVILGSTSGFLSSSSIMNTIGLLEKPTMPPVYAIVAPDFGLCFLRTFIGLFIVYITRQIVKTIILRSTCAIYGLDWKDPNVKRYAKVEMPYYYLTYFLIGFNVALTCPIIFRVIGINREYSYTEL